MTDSKIETRPVLNLTELKTIRRALRRVAGSRKWSDSTRAINQALANKLHELVQSHVQG